MSKKDRFVKLYKSATGTDPLAVDRNDKKAVKEFVKNLKRCRLVGEFREAVKEVEDEEENPAMMGLNNLFPDV